MAFWIFMTITALLIPFTMIGFGRYFLKSAPKEINAVFGYRTTISMKNKDTWEFAHNYCGKLWFYCGLVMAPISILVMICMISKPEDAVGTTGSILCAVQLFLLVGSILLTESALKRNFDKNGYKR